MRTLGLDVGERRIGVAISDPDGRMAVPMHTYERRGAGDVAALIGLAQREEARRIVVGLPISLDGSRGLQAEACEAFARGLREASDLPVELWDERLSSAEADHHLRATGTRGKAAKARRDAIAASIILQAFLDHERIGPPLPPIE